MAEVASPVRLCSGQSTEHPKKHISALWQITRSVGGQRHALPGLGYLEIHGNHVGPGVGVFDAVGMMVGVCVAVGTGVGVLVAVDVRVAVAVDVPTAVPVAVADALTSTVGVNEGCVTAATMVGMLA